MDRRWLWVRSWLVSPIQARKARRHVGHMWVGADVAVEAALALRTTPLVCASLMRLASAALAPDDSLPLHAGWSIASISQCCGQCPGS